MPFSDFDLDPASLRALDELGFTEPTPIQRVAIPEFLAGRDLIAQAHTGSGKTLAFGLPLVRRCDPGDRSVQVLILTPTRELAQQVADVLAAVAGPAGFQVLVIYGGVGYGTQDDALERGAQMVVGTPGRVLDHIRRGTLKTGAVRVLVLDEADAMLDQGFAQDLEAILRTTPASRQTVLFSATTPAWVHRVSARYLNEPVFVSATDDATFEPKIDHSVIEVWNGDKFPVLLALLSEEVEGNTLVFARTRHGAANLARRLQRFGLKVEALQGSMTQTARDRIIARFRSGRIPVLIATNVAARGLDILSIDRVINYDLPDTSELFVHRVGRTGRIGQYGQAITLVTVHDLPMLQEIERHLGKKLPRAKPPQVDLQALRSLEVLSGGSRPAQRREQLPPQVASASGARRRRRRRGRGQRSAAASPAGV